MALLDPFALRVIDPVADPDWRPSLLAHLLRLDPESRRLRFLTPMGDAGIAAHVAAAAPLALVVHAPDGAIRGCAALHPGAHCGEAELALSVEPGWQSRGLGAALSAAAMAEARRLGCHDVALTCLRQNTPMLRIARSLQARAQPLADWALALFHLDPQTAAGS